MKKTQWIDAFRNIKKRIVSFLSIVLIICLGTGGFLMTQFLSGGIRKEALTFYEKTDFKDFELISSVGIGEDVLELIRKQPDIVDAEGAIVINGKLFRNGSSRNVMLVSRTTKVSVPQLAEGRFPDKEDEAAVASDLMEAAGLKIGDVISLSSPKISGEEPLKSLNFTVTGIINHPDYVRKNQDHVVVLDESAFNEDTFNHSYTRAYILSNNGIKRTFADDYPEQIAATKEELKALLPQIDRLSAERIRDLASEKIDRREAEALEMLAEAEKEIADNEKLLDESLADARNKLNAGKKELESAYDQLVNADSQLDMKESELKKGKIDLQKADRILKYVNVKKLLQALKEIKGLLKDLKDAIDSGDQEMIDNAREKVRSFFERPEVREYIDALNEYLEIDLNSYIEETIEGVDLDTKIAYINKIIKKLNTYLNAKANMPKYEQQLADARYQVSLKWIEYEQGKAKLASEEAKFKAAEKENRQKIADARALFEEEKAKALQQIADARAEVANMDAHSVLQDRNVNASFMDLRSSTASMRSTGTVFGVLFALISSIVFFSTLSIIIEEEKKLVGTSKAFGFHGIEILGKYLTFGVLAGLTGFLIGVGLAYLLAEMCQGMLARQGLYCFGQAKSLIDPLQLMAIAAGIVILSGVAVYISCRQLLKTPASRLMKGDTLASIRRQERKKEAKNTKGSLYSRLIIRNMINEKARVIVFLLIVAGSVAMMGVGMNYDRSFSNSIKKETEEVQVYDYRVDHGALSEEQYDELIKVFEDNGITYDEANYSAHFYEQNGELSYIYLLVADDEQINEFFRISDPKTKQPIALPKDGILVQNKMEEAYGYKPGDRLVFLDNSLTRNEAAVSGYVLNYQGKLAVCSDEVYRQIFNKDVEHNCFYIKLNGADESVLNKIAAVSDSIGLDAANSFELRQRPILALLNFVVYTIILFAAVMSFMIITNLANIYMSKKKKELIVMRINGFSIKQTINYLSKEIILTTVAGLILGLVGGKPIADLTIRLVEMPDAFFDRSYHADCWVIAVVLEIIFTVIIYYLAFRKVRKLNFREI